MNDELMSQLIRELRSIRAEINVLSLTVLVGALALAVIAVGTCFRTLP